ncbi:MAG: hypothetical protein JXB85_10050 [Anaerolineales bacterium]|nr:hypothetical protein [Anaerolineales bacterium]
MSMSYLDKHPAGDLSRNRRTKTLEFLTGFAGWFALFSMVWTFAGVLGADSATQTNTLCLFGPGGIDMMIAVGLIGGRKWSALTGFAAAFLVNGLGLFIAAVLGFIPGNFNLAALVLHIPFFFPLLAPIP